MATIRTFTEPGCGRAKPQKVDITNGWSFDEKEECFRLTMRRINDGKMNSLAMSRKEAESVHNFLKRVLEA